MPFYLVMIGPPGAGKGTQAKELAGLLELAHVSTGDLFRDNIRAGSALGKRVEEILASGALVPDAVTIELVRERLRAQDCARGAILDGFPRTLPQAEALSVLLAEAGDKINLAPYIRVGDQVLVERLTGRRTDRRTGKIYHVKYNPPPPGADLEQRPDDAEQTVRRRIAEYYANTAPLLEYYRAAGVLREFDGELAIADVLKLIVTAARERLAA